MKTTITRSMKPIASMTLMLAIGVATAYAQDSIHMKFSGTSVPSTVDLQQPNTSNGEDRFSGRGTLGSFTFQDVRAMSNSPVASSTCTGTNVFYFQEPAGGGVFRFENGSLLFVNLTQGGDCINFATGEAHCALTFQITGGTGRFKNASGTLFFTETPVPVQFNASGAPVFIAATGEFTGEIAGVSNEQAHDDGQ